MAKSNHPSLAQLFKAQRTRPVKPVKPSIPTIYCPDCGENIGSKLAKLYLPELIKLGRILVRKVNKANKTAAAAEGNGGSG